MPNMTIEQAMEIAIQRHQRGELDGARMLYRQVLSYDAAHSDALNLLGVIHAQVGDHAEAERLMRRAIDARPGMAAYWNNLGNALRDAGRTDDALEAYGRAAELPGGSVESLGNLGNLLREVGRPGEAVDRFRAALATDPPAEVRIRLLNDMGAALGKAGRLDEAVDAFRSILTAEPDHAQAQQNLGVVLVQRGELDAGMAACGRAVALRGDLFEAHMNLGIALAKQGRYDEAAERCRRALELQPTNPKVHMNLVHVYAKQGRLDPAMEISDRLLALAPGLALAHEVKAGQLTEAGRLDEAIAAATRAIELDRATSMTAHSGRIFTRQFHLGSDAATQRADQRAWDAAYAAPKLPATVAFPNDRDPDRRLRVGYVSANFNNHCQSFFTVPLLSNHDKSQVEVFCYSDVSAPHAMTDKIKSLADHWRPVTGLPHEVLAQQVRDDRIDVLVDLTMHMSDSRLLAFARRPAPVQVTWLAYPGSTGLSAIDYRLTDPHLDPPGVGDERYVERSVRLPDTFWVYDPLEEVGVAPLPATSEAGGGRVTFGCLNNFCKVNADVLRLWARVMLAVEGSRLLLLSPMGRHRQWVERELAAAGVAPDRVEHVDRRSRQAYLEVYNRIDLCLDTFPYNGHTTSLDAYYMGVPVVTLVGDTVVGRAGLSQLTNLKLTELVAYDADAYVRLAVDLAHDRPRLAGLRRTLRDRMRTSPLMDGPRFARGMEAAFRTMWRDWCAVPDSDEASPD
jgi:protein O-GlcNAc transferase